MTRTSSPSPRAIAAFLLGCLCFGYAFVQRVAPSVMTDDLMRAFQVQAGALGTLSAFYFYAYAGIQMPVGVLMDRYGPRRLLSGAMALCLIGSAVFAFSESLWIAALGRALIGAAVAFAYVGTMTIAATWFSPARFTVSVGVLQTVGMIGAMMGQAPVSIAVEALGWRETLLGIGVLAAFLAAAIFLVVEELPDHRRSTPHAARGAFRDVLTSKDSWCCALIGFALTGPMLAFAGLWAVPWLRHVQGFGASEAALTASLLFLAWAITGPFVGLATERIGRRKPLLYIGLLLSGSVLTLFTLVPDIPKWSIPVLFILMGSGGCTMIITFSCIREVNAPSRAGAGLGFVNMLVVGSGAIFQPLLGFILDFTWDGTTVDGAPVYGVESYSAAFSPLLITYGIALIGCFLMRETFCKQCVEK